MAYRIGRLVAYPQPPQGGFVIEGADLPAGWARGARLPAGFPGAFAFAPALAERDALLDRGEKNKVH